MTHNRAIKALCRKILRFCLVGAGEGGQLGGGVAFTEGGLGSARVPGAGDNRADSIGSDLVGDIAVSNGQEAGVGGDGSHTLDYVHAGETIGRGARSSP